MSTAFSARHPQLQFSDTDDGRVVVVNAATRKYFRLGAREASFLASLDGTASIEQLRGANPGGFSNAEVTRLFEWFGQQGLLADAPGGAPAQTTRRQRLKNFFSGPDRWRVHLVDPDAFLDRHKRAIGRLFTPAALLAYLVILMLPLVVPVSAADFMHLSMDGLGPIDFAIVYVGILGVIALHELAHAITCKHFGGQVHRIGLMLLYLQPVVYCDVSDSWRFKERDHKIAVALAGCFVQLLLSSVLYTAWGLLHIQLLLVFAVVNLSVAAVNLLPFIKLDGYWVAVHLFDEPNLRTKAFEALLGPLMGRRSRISKDRKAGLCLFGLASALFTAAAWALGLQAIHRYAGYLSPTFAVGITGALVAFGLLRLGQWLKAALASAGGT
jgi:putative peptide zinc metalloprotease protein